MLIKGQYPSKNNNMNIEETMKEQFLKYIKGKAESINTGHKKSDELMVLYHLINLMSEKGFDVNFKYYFQSEKYSFDEGYFMFHKSMRNTDFYSIGEGNLDMIFWYFIHTTDIVYNTIKDFELTTNK